MTDPGAISFRMRRDARDMRNAAMTFRRLALNGDVVNVPAAELLKLASAVERSAESVALVAEAVALGKEIAE